MGGARRLPHFPPGSRGVTRSVHSPQGLRGLTWNSHFPPGSRRVTRSVHSPRGFDCSQLADLCRDVGRCDERLTHQHGVGSGHGHTLHLVAREEPALADDDVARGNPGQQLERRLDPRVERRQVTVVDADDAGADGQRSEEHTSELQSPCNLVCRLLLEKKKKKKNTKNIKKKKKKKTTIT